MINSLLIPQIAKMLIMMLVGFVLRKTNLLKKEESRGLSVVCLYAATPCAIMAGFQRDFSPSALRDILTAFFIIFLLHGVFLLISLFLHRVLHFTPIERVAEVYPNCGNLVIPLVTAVLGSDYVIYACVFITVQAIFLWTHGLSTLSHTRQMNLVKVITNPNIVAFVLGLLFFFTGFRFPPLLDDVCSTLGDFTAPLAMLVAGALLGDIKAAQLRSYRRLPWVLLLRLIGIPMVMLAVLKLAQFDVWLQADPMLLLVCFFCCMTPTASAVVQMSQLFTDDASYASVINALGMLACIGTMPLMIFIYQLLC